MRIVAATFLALLCSPCIADVVGHVHQGSMEIELYSTPAWCRSKDSASNGAAIYPRGKRDDFVKGCWRPASSGYEAHFEDGKVHRFKRSEIILERPNFNI